MFRQPTRRIAAILGILRAGGYYIVLDRAFPEERTRKILEDGAIQMILTDAAHVAFAKSLAPGIPVVDADASKPCVVPPPMPAGPGDLAYVAYTSGSTGTPKGVMHTQANVLHEAAVHRATLDLQSDDRSTLLYSLGVTGSIRDLFGMLLTGGAVCPFPFQDRGFAALTEWLRAQGITQVHAVPSLFRELVRTMVPKEPIDTVRTLYLAGERVLPEDVTLFRRHFPSGARFYTGIGATEASSIYTHWFVNDDKTREDERLPTGWPIPHKHVRIVDDRHMPLPHGEAGEIAVRSEYLATGYWRRPDLTAKVFEDSGDGSGQRTCYTGDYGYFDASGRLIHLGRCDRQVKVNGQRIELSDVEDALRAQPGIEAAAVSLCRGKTLQPRIVAYIVARENVNDRTLRTGLSRRLLAAAMPALFVRLESLPLNFNGKVDYTALPSPDIEVTRDPGSTRSWTHDEQRILDVWQQIFPGLSAHRRDDTFDSLAGDSLDAIRLIELLHLRIGLNLAPGAVGAESIATLATRLTKEPNADTKSPGLESGIDQLASLAASWRLAELGTQVAPACPVFLAGGDRPGTPLLWFGQAALGLEIGIAVSRARPVYLIPSAPAQNATDMDDVCDQLATLLTPHLPRRVLCGGPCYSGLLAMILARGLKERGIDVAGLILLDALGSRIARRAAVGAFDLTDPRSWISWLFVMLAGVRRVLLRRGPFLIPIPYLIGFVPFGYDGRIVHFLSSRSAWIRHLFPRLGWGEREAAQAQIHIVRGAHARMWKPPMSVRTAGAINSWAEHRDEEDLVESRSPMQLATVSDTRPPAAIEFLTAATGNKKH